MTTPPRPDIDAIEKYTAAAASASPYVPTSVGRCDSCGRSANLRGFDRDDDVVGLHLWLCACCAAEQGKAPVDQVPKLAAYIRHIEARLNAKQQELERFVEMECGERMFRRQAEEKVAELLPWAETAAAAVLSTLDADLGGVCDTIYEATRRRTGLLQIEASENLLDRIDSGEFAEVTA